MRVQMLGFILLALIGQGGQPEHGPLKATWLAEDGRLELSISLSSGSWYLGELCDELTRQTGVEIRANENDGTADAQMVVAFRNIRLGDALNAIQSLLSYQGYPYLWDRTGTPPAYRYVLSRSLKARRLPYQVAEKVQADFEAECAAHARLCRLSQAELEREAQTDPRASNRVANPRVKLAWQMLMDTISSETLMAIVRGETAVSIRTSDLPLSGHEFLKSVWAEGRRTIRGPDGSERPAPESDEVRIARVQFPEDAVAGLGIHVPHAGGYTYAGERLRVQRMVAEHVPSWLCEGDSATHALEGKPLKERGTSPVLPEGNASPLVRFVHTLSERAGISVLCRVPATPLGGFALPTGGTLGEWLRQLAGPFGLVQHKWHGDTLLLSYIAWYRDEGVQVPWRVEKQIRRRLASQRRMSFAELSELAASLTSREQSLLLAQRHPQLACAGSGVLKTLGALRLAQQALTPTGVPLTEDLRARLLSAGVTSEAEGTALRVVENRGRGNLASRGGTTTLVAGPGVTWWLEVLRQDGQWHRIEGYRMSRAPVPTSLK